MYKSSALAIGFQAELLDTLRNVEPTCEVVVPTDHGQVLPMLKERRFQAIFVDSAYPQSSPRDFNQLRQLAPETPTAVVGPQANTDNLARLVDDTAVYFLPIDLASADFALAARKLLLPRVSDRIALTHEDHRVKGQIGGWTFDHPLRDLSNRGLSFAVPVGTPLTAFLPGAVISDLHILDSSGAVMLGPVHATIRHCQLDRTEAGVHLRVGLSFDAQTTLVAPHKRVIADPLPVLARLRRAIQADVNFAVSVLDDETAFRLRGAMIEVDPHRVLHFAGPAPAELRAHDVVRLSYNHHGQSYVGLTSIVDAGDALRLAIPRSLRVYHRRGSPRHRPTTDRPYRVQIRAALTRCEGAFQVHDLNATGLSIEVDAAAHVLPPGLALDELILSLPDGAGPIRAKGIVRTLHALPRDAAGSRTPLARCGIEFLDLPDSARARLCASLLEDGFPHVEAAMADDAEAVRQFMTNARFDFQLYGDNSAQSNATLDGALSRMAGDGRKVGVNLLYRHEGEIYGRITGLRVFTRTWLATHLAARQGVSGGADRASRALTLGISEYLEHEPTAEFVKMIWKHDRRFSDRMFGWVGRMIHQPGLADGWDFAILVRPNAAGAVDAPAGVVVRSAEPEHLRMVEQHFAQTLNVVRIWAEDLTCESLELKELGGVYRSCGLQRDRALRIAFLDGAPAGFSVLERSTPGLQLADLASGFDVHVLQHVPADSHETIRAALVKDAVDFYRSVGVSHAIAMTEAPDLKVFESVGFTVIGHMRTRLWHRSLFRSWADYSEQVFKGVQERAQRRTAHRVKNDLVYSGGDAR